MKKILQIEPIKGGFPPTFHVATNTLKEITKRELFNKVILPAESSINSNLGRSKHSPREINTIIPNSICICDVWHWRSKAAYALLLNQQKWININDIRAYIVFLLLYLRNLGFCQVLPFFLRRKDSNPTFPLIFIIIIYKKKNQPIKTNHYNMYLSWNDKITVITCIVLLQFSWNV